MIRRPPRSTRTDTLFPYTTLFRSSVANGGGAAVPYGISRITTGAGEVLYERTPAEPRVLVAPWVAASMTDLLKAAVATGTGRAAQTGRPQAGKTGTTRANRDGTPAERRVGPMCVSTRRSRRSPHH